MMLRSGRNTVEVRAPYGKRFLSGRIPKSALLHKAEPRMIQGISDFSKEIAEAIRHPIRCDSLEPRLRYIG